MSTIYSGGTAANWLVLSFLLSSSFLSFVITERGFIAEAASSLPSVPSVNYVVVIMMENHPLNISSCCGGVNGIIGNAAAPYITQLARNSSLAENYFATTPGSLGDYLSLIGGSTFSNMPCVANESAPTTCNTTALNLIDRIEASSRTWKAYMEDYTGGCSGTNTGAYDYWHNPFLYFADIRNNTSRCGRIVQANPGHVGAPDNRFLSDLNSTTTASDFMWLTPNENNNMHGYNTQPPSISTGDNYLSQLIPLILKTPVFTTQNAAILLVWDEPTTCSITPVTACPVPAIWLGPATRRNYASMTPYTHYSSLATIEGLWNLSPLTNNDSNATPMLEFFTPTVKYSLSNSGNLGVVQGGSAYSDITVRQTSGTFKSNMSLSMSCNGLPLGASCSFSPNQYSCNHICTSILRVKANFSTPIGKHSISIAATWGTQTNSTTLALDILGPLLQRGDVNGDCRTNIFDLAIVAGNFGKKVGPLVNPRADLNLDGEINVIDLAIVASNLGTDCH